MAFPATVFRILIASPGDVAEERIAARDLIHHWNAWNSDRLQAVMLPIMWETHATPAMGDRPQAIINKQLVQQCDALIGIFWTRIGTPTGVAESGSVEEIEQFIASSKPAMLYFSSKPIVPGNLDQKQFKRLKAFRKKCQAKGLIESFATTEELRFKLVGHLSALGQQLTGKESKFAPPGAGQYQGMVYTTIADGVAGWAFPFLTDIPL